MREHRFLRSVPIAIPGRCGAVLGQHKLEAQRSLSSVFASKAPAKIQQPVRDRVERVLRCLWDFVSFRASRIPCSTARTFLKVVSKCVDCLSGTRENRQVHAEPCRFTNVALYWPTVHAKRCEQRSSVPNTNAEGVGVRRVSRDVTGVPDGMLEICCQNHDALRLTHS